MSDPTDSTPPEPSVQRQIGIGAIWMLLLNFLVRGLGLISTLILVRLLTPEDFGLVAMATVFVAVVQVFSWFSFDMALIQRQSAERMHYDTAWTFNILFKTASALVLAAAALPIARYYAEPRVAAIIAVLAFNVFVAGFENVGIVDFRKQMQFDKEFRFQLLRKIAAFIVTVPLAFALRNYWALIAGLAFSAVFALAMSYVLSPYRPRLSLAGRHDLFNFSKWLFLCNIFNAIRHRAPEFALGKVWGPTGLGLFSVSYEISNLPTSELVSPINRAVFPGYSKISGDLERLREGYLSVLAVIALFAIPAGAGIAATAPVLVPVALGDQWLQATPLVAVLAFFGIIIAMQTNIASVFMSLGKPHVLTALYATHTVVMLAMIIPAILYRGIEAAALAYVGSALLLLPLNYIVLVRAINLPVQALLSRIWRPLLAAGVMYAVVAHFSRSAAAAGGGLVPLLLLCVAGAGIYTGLVAGSWWLAGRPAGAETYALAMLRRRLARSGEDSTPAA